MDYESTDLAGAAHLARDVIPDEPERDWAPSVPDSKADSAWIAAIFVEAYPPESEDA